MSAPSSTGQTLAEKHGADPSEATGLQGRRDDIERKRQLIRRKVYPASEPGHNQRVVEHPFIKS